MINSSVAILYTNLTNDINPTKLAALDSATASQLQTALNDSNVDTIIIVHPEVLDQMSDTLLSALASHINNGSILGDLLIWLDAAPATTTLATTTADKQATSSRLNEWPFPVIHSGTKTPTIFNSEKLPDTEIPQNIKLDTKLAADEKQILEAAISNQTDRPYVKNLLNTAATNPDVTVHVSSFENTRQTLLNSGWAPELIDDLLSPSAQAVNFAYQDQAGKTHIVVAVNSELNNNQSTYNESIANEFFDATTRIENLDEHRIANRSTGLLGTSTDSALSASQVYSAATNYVVEHITEIGRGSFKNGIAEIEQAGNIGGYSVSDYLRSSYRAATTQALGAYIEQGHTITDRQDAETIASRLDEEVSWLSAEAGLDTPFIDFASTPSTKGDGYKLSVR